MKSLFKYRHSRAALLLWTSLIFAAGYGIAAARLA